MPDKRKPPTVQSTASSRQRAACDECGTKKLKCTGDRPACARCVGEGLQCVYSPQKTMGRPKKRLRVSNENGTTQGALNPGALPADETTASSTATLTMPASDAPELEAMSWLSPSKWPDFDYGELAPQFDQDAQRLISDAIGNGQDEEQQALDTPVSIFNATDCACLSSLYLALHSLQSPCCDPHQVSFLHAVQPLREAMQTASRVIPCQICPKRFLSAIQNVHLMGTLLLCIAERFGKILSRLSEDAKRASSVGELKTFRLLDMSNSDAELCESYTAAFDVTLSQDDWLALCKKVLRAEVMGPSKDGTDAQISLSALCRSMRQRQDRWHQMKCPEDFPRDIRPTRASPPGNTTLEHAAKHGGPGEGEHFCVKMVSVAEKLMDSFDWT